MSCSSPSLCDWHMFSALSSKHASLRRQRGRRGAASCVLTLTRGHSSFFFLFAQPQTEGSLRTGSTSCPFVFLPPACLPTRVPHVLCTPHDAALHNARDQAEGGARMDIVSPRDGKAFASISHASAKVDDLRVEMDSGGTGARP